MGLRPEEIDGRVVTPQKQFVIKATARTGPPQGASNPEYPEGIDVDPSNGADKTCVADLPYPASERLVWMVRCKKCGIRVAVTAAGRADDPRSVKIPCKETLQ